MKNDILLAKWLNDDITPEELIQLKDSPEYASYIKIAETAAEFQAPEFDKKKNFEAIMEQIELKKNSKKVIKLNPLATFLKIAAVFAILFAGYVFVNSLSTTVSTQIAEKQSFLLPDQSKVVLNANSSIEYQKKNWDNKRLLNLEGEAYFKVNKGKKFSIKTKEGVITVLGTQFNVFARNNNLFVTCYEGLVSVSNKDTLIKLPAGEKLVIANNKILSHTKLATNAPSWINSESSFENTPLSLVIQELEAQYPIKVTTKNIDLDQRYSGSFTHKNLTLALRLICEPLNLSFTTDGKEKVTLYANKNKQ